MASRAQRHKRIVDLVATLRIQSQQELQEILADEGIATTQATLSRDLQDLGVLKGPGGYVIGEAVASPEDRAKRLEQALRRELLSAELAGTLVVLRTRPGHANSLASEFDSATLPMAVGTIAGDDTIFVAARSLTQAKALAAQLLELAGHE